MEHMKRPRLRALRTVWLLLAALAGLALISYAFVASAPKPPVYHGKSLYEWLDQLNQATANSENTNRVEQAKAAQSAIRAIGTNALPFALADLRARATFANRATDWLAIHAPFLRLQTKDPEGRWALGVETLGILGPIAKPCLPKLIAQATNHPPSSAEALLAVGAAALPAFTNILSKSKYPERMNLFEAFTGAVAAKWIAPEEAAAALPCLIQVYHDAPVSHERWFAAEAIGSILRQPELCVPRLREGLSDPSSDVRWASAEVLGKFGSHATNAIPALEKSCSDANEQVRSEAASALRLIRQEPAQPIPIPGVGMK